MNLLVVILNRPDRLEELLEAYIENDIPGATILDSVGMGSILGREVPIFAGFRDVFAGNQPNSKVLFSFIEESTRVEMALDVIDALMNPPGQPGAAFSFVVPVTQVRAARLRRRQEG
jgi:nitrogen regulatory protein PII